MYSLYHKKTIFKLSGFSGQLNLEVTMSISMKELLGDTKLESLPKDHQANMQILFDKMNKVRAKYGKPMKPTSVYRSMAEHLAIYARKGITDKKLIPMKSKHLYGQACDIADPDLKLTKWLKENPEILEQIGLWCEEGNKNWVHFQILPPKSGSRWFLP